MTPYRPLPHQQLAHDFLLDNPRAGLFAEMGLGKTAATLRALTSLAADGNFKAALVIAPLRVATMTWPNEIAKWDCTRWMRVESLRNGPPSGRSHIYLLNYESIPKLTDLSGYSHVILDELTRAKNPKSKRIRHLARMLKPEHSRWGLTGTPRPNSLLELFAQIRLLDGGQRLGRTFTEYRDRWFDKADYMGYTWKPKPGAEADIYARIADLTLTLRAADHLDVPPTVVEDIEVALPEEARGAYKELEKELLLALGPQGDVVALNAATLCNKLLQICGGSVYNETKGVVEMHDAKVKALKTLLKSLPAGENALIFTNYVHERERVAKAIGGTDAAKFKGDIESAWNEKRLGHLVADPRSLGHGLNLQHGGRTIIWFSPTWSREQYDQANARVARSGQTETPLVYRILCSGTMDDAVVESLREKGDGQSEMMRVLANFRLTAEQKAY